MKYNKLKVFFVLWICTRLILKCDSCFKLASWAFTDILFCYKIAGRRSIEFIYGNNLIMFWKFLLNFLQEFLSSL